MRAQVVLTRTESKKLIALAVARMDVVKKAMNDGLIVMHPSSSTYFIVEELTGRKPPTNVWVCGVVTPKGTCVEMGMSARLRLGDSQAVVKGGGANFTGSWVLRRGEFVTGMPLQSWLSEMGPQDVYIKGANALDFEGKVGVLMGIRGKACTIIRAIAARKERGFTIIFPIGYEKLIPIPVKAAAHEAMGHTLSYSTGEGCHLLPCEGDVVTEVKAIDILSGSAAFPIAAGGLGGAEGAVVLVVRGEPEQVNKAISFIEQSKGAKLPQLRTANCHDCFVACAFPVGDKHWVA